MTDSTTGQRAVPIATLAILMVAASGAVDGLTYFHLGGAFSSAMTGNLALLGISIGGLKPGLLMRVVVAVAAYAIGVMACTVFARRPFERHSSLPREATTAMQFAILPAFAAAVCLATGWAGTAAQLTELFLFALTMGVQSGAYRYVQVDGVLGSTYVSGNFVVFFARLARGQSDWAGLLSLLALALAALVEVVIIRAAPRVAGVLPLLVLTSVVVLATMTRPAAETPVAADT